MAGYYQRVSKVKPLGPLDFQFLGEQTVKNIARPVGAYKVFMDPRALHVEEKIKAKEVSFWQRKAGLK